MRAARRGHRSTQELAELGLDLDEPARARAALAARTRTSSARCTASSRSSSARERPPRAAPARLPARPLRRARRAAHGFAPLEPAARRATSRRRASRSGCAPPRGRLESSGTLARAARGAALVRRRGRARRPRLPRERGLHVGLALRHPRRGHRSRSKTSCAAQDTRDCRFVAREAEAWRAGGDARALALLDALPFAALRELAARAPAAAAGAARHGERFEPGSPVIHVWGPVMVLPFAAPTSRCARSS